MNAISPEQRSAQPLTVFNAIKLSASAVAKSFIAPPAFEDLVRAQNAILTGPRGSGKTTLLKMLASEALENWSDPIAPDIRSRVDSVGVFIGSDRTWNEQLMAPAGAPNAASYATLAWAAFGTHTIRSLVDAMNYRLRGPVASGDTAHLRAQIAPEEEAKLASALGDYLELNQRPTSLPGLRELLVRRLAAIGATRRALFRDPEITLPSWMDFDVITTAAHAVFQFNEAADDTDRHWSLLFDELELAPEAIVHELLGALRGDQPNLLFKLSLAPADSRLEQLSLPIRPVPGQDYEHVSLTYARKLKAVDFARKLASAQLAANGADISVDRLLGPSLFDGRDGEGSDLRAEDVYGAREPYRQASPLWNAFSRLADRDSTFQKYLDRSSISLDDLGSAAGVIRAAKLRKVRNIVVTREYFRADNGRRRSRKSSELYAGSASMLSLPDGNPRMTIALMRQLIPLANSGSPIRAIPRKDQGAAIDVTLARFRALLSAQEPVMIAGERVTLTSFLDLLGNELASHLVEAPFSDNVALTFNLDESISEEIRKLVVRGVNAGALIYVPQRGDSEQVPDGLLGAQFRLAYLLCADYGLPIHLTRSVSLSSLLPEAWSRPGTGRRRRRIEPIRPEQAALFDVTPTLDVWGNR